MRDEQSFTDLVGSTLTIEEAALAMGVIAVEPSGRHHFSVLFSGPAEPVLEQATYTFRHEGETTAIFIVPIASDGESTTYEAVFAAETADAAER